MRVNRFVFLNRHMLSLEVHLGVTASSQAPFPTDFVTLPVSASHRRFGSFPLAAEKGQAQLLLYELHWFCIPNMLKQLYPRKGRPTLAGVLHEISAVPGYLPLPCCGSGTMVFQGELIGSTGILSTVSAALSPLAAGLDRETR